MQQRWKEPSIIYCVNLLEMASMLSWWLVVVILQMYKFSYELYLVLVKPLMACSCLGMLELLISSSVKLPSLQLYSAIQTSALKQKFVIISQRWCIAGPNAKPFTGLLMPPEAILVHSQPWNKYRKGLGFVSLQIKSLSYHNQPEIECYFLSLMCTRRERDVALRCIIIHTQQKEKKKKLFSHTYLFTGTHVSLR